MASSSPPPDKEKTPDSDGETPPTPSTSTQLSIDELYAQLREANKQLAHKTEKCDKLTLMQRHVDDDIHELTEHLFAQAYKMAGDEEGKRRAAEQRLAEATMAMDVMQAELSMLKQIVRDEQPLARRSSDKRSKTAHKLKNRFFPSSKKERTASPPSPKVVKRVYLLDPVARRELIEWQCHHSLDCTPANVFIHRLYEEEIRPAFNFDNRTLAEQVLTAVEENRLSIEETLDDGTCSLTLQQCPCAFRMRLAGNLPWMSICTLARNRIVAVCDLLTDLRYERDGLMKAETVDDCYDRLRRHRLRLAHARLGVPNDENVP